MTKDIAIDKEKREMANIGVQLASDIREKALSLEDAIDILVERISSFISISVVEGGLPISEAKECAAAALEAGVTILVA
ncbi:hypothetical protein J2D73_08185 [Acetobacter sacchari]|uniref:Uncharacterized protein n=1 Tax=Acetobacter sacchari TaxID=2661687 RepID=A0ABS3LV31_9PROT|nr:hypothetical protein [Acetobacter sacchari]MBO1359771.1 hypothetical protein [Acetobacter sacchari]